MTLFQLHNVKLTQFDHLCKRLGVLIFTLTSTSHFAFLIGFHTIALIISLNDVCFAFHKMP